MIKPSIGRVVWVARPANTNDASQPEVGLIAYVHSDACINVAGFDHSGQPFVLTSLPLIQEGEAKPEGNFAMWMPYQIGQAKKVTEPM